MSISVVIPTYNRCQTTCRAIDSVLAQTRQADQIIVIDDGSTDGTCARIGARYGTAITLLTQSNRGVSAARNNGIDNASGDWIALLDSDDEWLPDKLEIQHQHLSQHPGAVLSHTDEIWIRNGKRVNPMKKHQKYGGDIFTHCLDLCVMSPSSVVIKTHILKSIGKFDNSLPACEDYDLWLRICAHFPVLFTTEPQLIKYGGHSDQLSRQYWGMDRFRIKALQRLLASHCLTSTQHIQTVNALVNKTQILLTGAAKHNNASLIDECTTILANYDSASSSPETARC